MRVCISFASFLFLAITVPISTACPTLMTTSTAALSAEPYSQRALLNENSDTKSHGYSITTSALSRKRDVQLTNFGNGWVGYITTFDSFLPVQTAAAALFRFYISVYNQLRSIPTDRPPQYQFSLGVDNLTLKFFSADAPIPWRFMAAVAWRMATLARSGFTGRHDSVYVYQPTGQAIRISLEVILVAAAA